MTALKAIAIAVLAAVVIAAGVLWLVDRSTQHELPDAPTPTPIHTTLGGHS